MRVAAACLPSVKPAALRAPCMLFGSLLTDRTSLPCRSCRMPSPSSGGVEGRLHVWTCLLARQQPTSSRQQRSLFHPVLYCFGSFILFLYAASPPFAIFCN